VSRAGPAQTRVRETLAAFGGYWRPLAEVARILEEMGELAETLAAERPAHEVAEELADLWIISTALADQFLVWVAEPGGQAPAATLGELLAAAGTVARIVNYYDGPKDPRAPDSLPPLADAIPAFHRALAGFCGVAGVDLARAVQEKLEVIVHRDAGRFGPPAWSDPSAAPVLAAFASAGRGGLGPDARLWGAPDASAAAVLAGLRMFARAAGPERLDGYIVAAPPAPAREGWVGELLGELARRPPGPAPAGLHQDLLVLDRTTFEVLAVPDDFIVLVPRG
jgi:HAMP domain-containing protein